MDDPLYDLAMKLHQGGLVWITRESSGERIAGLVHKLPDGTFGVIEEREDLDALHQNIRNDDLIARMATRSPLALIQGKQIFAYLLSVDDAERVLDRRAYHIALEAMESHESLDIDPDPDQP